MEEKHFICHHQDCGKIFTTKYNLVRHVNTLHLGILDYACAQCNRSFTSKGGLQSHLLSHKRKSGGRAPRVSSLAQLAPSTPAAASPQLALTTPAPRPLLTPLNLPEIADDRRSMGTIPLCSKLICRKSLQWGLQGQE